MEYLVTKLSDMNAKKIRVEVNFDIVFSLYKGEVRKYHIAEQECIEPKIYDVIMNDILPKRAKERCLNLLGKRSMTEAELRRKLIEGAYPKNIIDDLMDKLQEYHFVDDKDYTTRYIETYCKSKSVRQMKQDLQRKGIAKNEISARLEEIEVDETENICRLMKKRGIDANTSLEVKNKFCAYLLRKGYDYEKICSVVLR